MARPAGLAQAAAGGLLSYFTRHPTAANLLMVILLVSGLVAAPQMRTQFFPDIIVEELDIRIAWEGAGPEEVDQAIVAPVLPKLQGVEGAVRADAVARADLAIFEVEFEPGWDMAEAAADVDAALDSATDLPEAAERPEVTQSRWRNEVVQFAISGPVGVDQLARIADLYNTALFRAGVTRTVLTGIAAPEITVTVSSAALIRHQLTLQEISNAVSGAAVTDPSGSVDAANARLRTGVERRSARTIAALPLRTRQDGSVLRVGDVADVSVAGHDRDVALYNGDDPAVELVVQRGPADDAVDLRLTAERVAAALEPDLPDGVTITPIRSRADAISDRLALLMKNAATGLALVLGLLFLFLNARTALWVAAGIPVAMLAAISVMYLGGLSLNMISLFGLIITLGIVVDDAIVVGEHADFRARHLGEPPAVAAERAARRMALPVFSAAVTTLIAFWALTTIGGPFGEMILALPITVLAVLIASLVECFLILPHHMAGALHAVDRRAWYDWPSRQVNRGLDWVRRRVVRPGVAVVIQARYPVLAGAILLLSVQAAWLISERVPWRFFNAPERSTITADFLMLPAATRADTEDQRRELQRALAVVAAELEAEHGINPVAFALARTGANAGRGPAGAATREADLKGGLRVRLIGSDARPYPATEVLRRMREEVVQLPLTQELSFRSQRSGPGGDAIEVRFTGAEARQLKAAAEELKRRLGLYPQVSGLTDSMPWDRRVLLLEPTPQARQLGFTAEEIGTRLRHRLDGMEAASFAVGPRTGTIRVEVPEAERSADFLQRLLLLTAEGGFVPLADLVTVEEVPGFAEIQRVNGLQVLTVSGDLAQEDAIAAAGVRAALADQILPEVAAEFQVSYGLAGQIAEERAFLSDAAVGVLLCLLGIYLTLAWIFGSWLRPMVIMAVIPFGLIGAIWGHDVWDTPMSIFSIVGLIGMIGIIVNDSIVLVSTIDDYAERRGLRPAIIDAVADRLRPVLLTTLTTVLGLAPLLFETSRQAQFLKPAVITLVFGLAVGMFLVLILVPALLAIGADLRQSWASARRSWAVPALRRAPVSAFAAVLAGWSGLALALGPLTGQSLAERIGLADQTGVWGDFILFAVGVAVLLSLALAIAALAARPRARRA